jgi:hypothetical protein
MVTSDSRGYQIVLEVPDPQAPSQLRPFANLYVTNFPLDNVPVANVQRPSVLASLGRSVWDFFFGDSASDSAGSSVGGLASDSTGSSVGDSASDSTGSSFGGLASDSAGSSFGGSVGGSEL